MKTMILYPRALVQAVAYTLLVLTLALASTSLAQTPLFHFESICRSDPAENKNSVTVILHDESNDPLADVTIKALWSYVDYRQNHAVFRYKQDSCTTDRYGECTFHGGNGRARWQLSEVIGYDLSSPAFDDEPSLACPNTFMIDFW
jgi:hypothetical protein